MHKNSIWITGCNGKMGSELMKLLKGNTDYRVVGTSLDVDVTDEHAVEQAIDLYMPQIVINCAGVSDAAYCEKHQLEAYKVNALGARNLAMASRRKNARIIHFSSDDVFSGEHNRPKTEFDNPTPRTVYGKSKLAGENFVRELNPKHLIIRSSWVYGLEEKAESPSGFYQQVIDHGLKGEAFTAPIDVIGTPTSVLELGRFFMKILKSNEYGIFHASCEGGCTRYGYARAVLELNGLDAGLVSESLQEKDGLLVSTQLENLMMKMTGIYEMPQWRDAMKEYVEKNRIGGK